MSADGAKRREDLTGMSEVPPQHRGGDELFDDVPRRTGGLGPVIGVRLGHALADTSDAVPFHQHQDEGALVDPAEARLEESDQRKAQEPQLDPLDSHATML